MEKRYSWGFQIGSWALLCIALLLFLVNIFMYAYLSPSVEAIAGKAGEEQGVLSIQILPPGISPLVEFPVAPSGEGGGGGGGGGGVGIGAQTSSVGELTTRIEREIEEGQYISFLFGKVSHSISVTELTETTATLVVKSKEFRFVLSVGEQKRIDFEGDGKDEINIKLKSIDMTARRAVIILTPLYIPNNPFEVSPNSLSVSLVAGEKVVRQLTIRNYLPKPAVLSSEVSLLKSVLEVPQYVSLQAIEEKTIDIKIGPAEKGLLTGKILFTSGVYSQEVPVVIDVKSRNFLFDVSVMIPSLYKRVVAGTEIPLEINLQQVANPVKVDVSVNYIVKDFSGVVYLDEHETIFVDSSKEYIKKLSTAGLPLGKYIAGIEVQYPGAFATSSSQFEIITKEEAEISKISKYLSIIAISLVAISILLIIRILLRQESLERRLIKKRMYRERHKLFPK